MSVLCVKKYQHDNIKQPHLVLLHGWGAHSGVWQSILPSLQEVFTLTCIDLPGHGYSDESPQNKIEGWAEAVLAVAPEKAIWLGWSLGGLVAQQITSMAPHRVEKLILLASTPRFITATDWPEAIDESIFRDFHTEVIRDPKGSLMRFIALQTRGSQTAPQDSRLLKKTLLQPEPKSSALDIGMQLLLTTDLRDKSSSITQAVLWLAGERDTLVPQRVENKLKKIFLDFHSVIIQQAGHAPFLSHPEQFSQAVIDFCFNSDTVKYKEAQ